MLTELQFDGQVIRQSKPLLQWCIVRVNLETYVAWAETRQEAIE